MEVTSCETTYNSTTWELVPGSQTKRAPTKRTHIFTSTLLTL